MSHERGIEIFLGESLEAQVRVYAEGRELYGWTPAIKELLERGLAAAGQKEKRERRTQYVDIDLAEARREAVNREIDRLGL